jgi:hypothetical protein
VGHGWEIKFTYEPVHFLLGDYLKRLKRLFGSSFLIFMSSLLLGASPIDKKGFESPAAWETLNEQIKLECEKVGAFMNGYRSDVISLSFKVGKLGSVPGFPDEKACIITADGPSTAAIADIDRYFEKNQWKPDYGYSTDGACGGRTGYFKDSTLCIQSFHIIDCGGDESDAATTTFKMEISCVAGYGKKGIK